ncbi:hypothetical protein JXO59_14225 [candidate division KSB1 bacterium]|nr:hypothetical protein [candidate division KSB1 bacterium]
MMGDETMFGVNLADGRIKGYPTGPMPGQTEAKSFYVLYVRGDTTYGTNNFLDNNDGTITVPVEFYGFNAEQANDPGKIIWDDHIIYAPSSHRTSP